MKKGTINSSRIVAFSSFMLCFFFLIYPCRAGDTLNEGQMIRDGETLISSGETFALGFFNSWGSSSRRYLGIWYHNISSGLVVWVANRDTPFSNSAGVLTITNNGSCLLVLDKEGRVLWTANASTSVSSSRANLSVSLMDSGNLVLSQGGQGSSRRVVLWQSFDYPSNTLLPGMRMSLNLQTGDNTVLWSWQNAGDPARGIYAFGIDPQRVRQLVTWRESYRIYRSGLWNGRTFEGIYESKSSVIKFSSVSNHEEISYTYHILDRSILTRFVLDIDGQLKQLKWSDEKGDWVRFWSAQNSACDMYNQCQENSICNNSKESSCGCLKGFNRQMAHNSNEGDWPERCQRQVPLRCRKDDQFEMVSNMKLPDKFLVYDGSSTDECLAACRRNCSCTAYAFADIRGEGRNCLAWEGDLVDLTEYDSGGNDLYVRLGVSQTQTDSKGGTKHELAISIGTVVPGLIMLGICIWYLWKIKIRRNGNKVNELDHIHSDLHGRIAGKPGEGSKKGTELPLFDFQCIASSTNDFSNYNKLGEGGFGPVYKGKLMDGQEIAVKRLSRSSGQGLEEFKNEVRLISMLQHRNLVKLLGCCIQEEEKVLIYEYMANKSLDLWLFDWSKRVRVITGIARGLLYLHHDSRLRIIHRDLKASNILLDEEMNPKISDFGMARIFRGNQLQANTNRVVGTYGYMSPEYAMKGLFSVKSDVFSFGVLLLEIVTGKRNNSSLNLLGHVWKLWKEGECLEAMDPSLRDSCLTQELIRYIHVGLLCVQESTEDRPTMPSVLIMLASESTSLQTPNQPAFYSEKDTDNSDVTINNMTITMLDAR